MPALPKGVEVLAVKGVPRDCGSGHDVSLQGEQGQERGPLLTDPLAKRIKADTRGNFRTQAVAVGVQSDTSRLEFAQQYGGTHRLSHVVSTCVPDSR